MMLSSDFEDYAGGLPCIHSIFHRKMRRDAFKENLMENARQLDSFQMKKWSLYLRDVSNY